MRGRPRKPTILKIISGNPGRRPLNNYEPMPEPALADPPDDLPDSAKVEWLRLAPELYSLGMLTNLDRTVLEAYCYAYGEWKEAIARVRRMGAIVLTKDKNIIQNPWLVVANKKMEQMRAFLIELGLSPVSRSRIKAKPIEGKNKFQEFLRSRRKG